MRSLPAGRVALCFRGVTYGAFGCPLMPVYSSVRERSRQGGNPQALGMWLCRGMTFFTCRSCGGRPSPRRRVEGRFAAFLCPVVIVALFILLFLRRLKKRLDMDFIRFVKKWTLLCAMAAGAGVYLLFAEVGPLQPVGSAVGPWFVQAMPLLIFAILYVTFCKIRLHDLHLSAWHVWVQAVRVSLALLLIAMMRMLDGEPKLLLEGAFVCVMCPTAAAAAVVTDKLGGSIASMTVYTLVDNMLTAVLIPLLFPLVERGAAMGFAASFLMILEKVALVLVLPFCCAMATRRWWPSLAARIQSVRNLAFYMWAFNLSVVMGITLHNILTAAVTGEALVLLIVIPLGVTLLLFAVGKAIGRRYGDSVSGGQAMGQKNTIVGIWLTVSYLNPTAAIAPCAYVVWQNTVNAWQLWCKEKYGVLKW